MSLEGSLAAGRRAAESRMTSRATLRRPTGTTTKDADGYDTPDYDETYASVPFRLPGVTGATSSRTVRVGASEVEVATRYADFPWNLMLQDGDLFEVTAGERAGRFFRVVESTGADQQTKLRVPIIEVQRPEGWL